MSKRGRKHTTRWCSPARPPTPVRVPQGSLVKEDLLIQSRFSGPLVWVPHSESSRPLKEVRVNIGNPDNCFFQKPWVDRTGESGQPAWTARSLKQHLQGSCGVSRFRQRLLHDSVESRLKADSGGHSDAWQDPKSRIPNSGFYYSRGVGYRALKVDLLFGSAQGSGQRTAKTRQPEVCSS